jgi:methionyl aminopeptidase
MAIIIKTKEEIEILREGGKRHAFILAELAKMVKPGVSTQALEDSANKLIADGGDTAAFLNYKPYGARRPYPASLCVSINDEIVHGIPNEGEKILCEGDVVSLDLGLVHKGMITDSAVTVPVGKVDSDSKALLSDTKKALMLGIKAARGGGHVGDIGAAIEGYARPRGYGIVRELAGHGVGRAVHEDPYVPNYGEVGTGDELVPGMVIAIEPMLNIGTERIKLDKDGYTYRSLDGSKSAHFEHTVLITKKGAEILTKE